VSFRELVPCKIQDGSTTSFRNNFPFPHLFICLTISDQPHYSKTIYSRRVKWLWNSSLRFKSLQVKKENTEHVNPLLPFTNTDSKPDFKPPTFCSYFQFGYIIAGISPGILLINSSSFANNSYVKLRMLGWYFVILLCQSKKNGHENTID